MWDQKLGLGTKCVEPPQSVCQEHTGLTESWKNLWGTLFKKGGQRSGLRNHTNRRWGVNSVHKGGPGKKNGPTRGIITTHLFERKGTKWGNTNSYKEETPEEKKNTQGEGNTKY